MSRIICLAILIVALGAVVILVSDVSNANSQTLEPPPCLLYAVNNQRSDDSQFLAIDFTAFLGDISPLGPIHPDANIHGLDIHPLTGELFASSGDHGKKDSQLYQVDSLTGELSLVGTIHDENGIGFEDVAGLSFHPDGILWGFAAKGHPTRRGLITIDPATGVAELVAQLNIHVEGLAWTPDGSALWLATQKDLLSYLPPGGTMLIGFTLSELPGNIKGLEFRPDGMLMVGMHYGGGVNVYVVDISGGGEIVTTDSFETEGFKNITGLAWPDWCTAGLPQISDPLDPTVDNTLSYTDSSGLGITIFIPAGALTDTTTFGFVELDLDGIDPANFAFTDQAFRLSAFRDGALLPDFTFEQSVTATLFYTDAHVAGLDENTLTLDYWNGSQWVDAATTCSPTSVYDRHPDENWLAVGICHLTEFGLFGEAAWQQQRLYLPLVLKDWGE